MAPELKQKPSGIWFVEFEGEDGKRKRISTRSRDKTVARAKMRDIVLGLDPHAQTQRTQSNHKAGTGLTMSDLFERARKTIWSPSEAKSQATIRSNIKILSSIVGDVPIQDMTYTKLEELVKTLTDRGYAPGTVKRKMDAVSRVLKMATKWTDAKGRPLLASKPPMPTIRVANTKDRVLSYVEEAAAFNAIDARAVKEPARQWRRFRHLVNFLLKTAARLSEALDTGPNEISTHKTRNGDETQFVTFARYRTKNDKPRSIPLATEVVENLASLEDNLGMSTDGEDRPLYFPMTPGTAWYMWNTVREDLSEIGIDISDVTLHTLRHTCLTRLSSELDLLRLQKWAGHSDPKITAERYVHLAPDDLVGGLDVLNASNPAIRNIQPVDSERHVNEAFDKHEGNRAESGTLN